MMLKAGDGQDFADRQRIEEEFHDSKARTGVHDFYAFGALSEADEFLFMSLGDLRKKRLLEIGCGDGSGTVAFAEAGAHVSAIDISGEMVELTRRAARERGLGDRVTAEKMSGEDIDFPEGTFDVVYGHSILHHLNLRAAGPRIARVLKRGGLAAFLEPLDYNPVLNLFRLVTPHRRTPTEKPVRWEQLESLASEFASWHHQEFYLVSLLAFFWYYVVRNRTLFVLSNRHLSRIDRWLFRHVPVLRRYAWVTVVWYVK